MTVSELIDELRRVPGEMIAVTSDTWVLTETPGGQEPGADHSEVTSVRIELGKVIIS